MARTLPASVIGRDVVFGAGPAAAVFAATRAAMGFGPPIVFEQNLAVGGVFSQLLAFRMNSVNGASVQSVASGPSRVVPLADSDDLNWLPNSAHQVKHMPGAWEYPSSSMMCRAVALTLKDHGEVYTSAKGMKFDRYGRVYSPDGDDMGIARRIIFAGGVVPRYKDVKFSTGVMSGFKFLAKPVTDLENLKIAVIGAGDTAAQVIEYMLGQGMNAPATFPRQIHWYGKDVLPTTKEGWMVTAHARWAGLGRHFPQEASRYTSVIRPYPVRGRVVPMGKSAMVNDQVYDLAVMCNGVEPAPCDVPVDDVFTVGGMTVAKANGTATIDGVPKVFKIGTAANLITPYGPYKTRFSAANDALYNLAPRTAAFAASFST